MTRVKRGTTLRRRHKKFIKMAKGHHGQKSKLYREARRSVMKGGTYAFAHRKQKKRTYRTLWIARLNAALRPQGITYSRFINVLFKKHIDLDRKVLAHLAAEKPEVFNAVVATAMK